jgi:hypothetical protein
MATKSEQAASSSRTGHTGVRVACSDVSAQVSEKSAPLGRPRLSALDRSWPLPSRSQNRTARSRCCTGDRLRPKWSQIELRRPLKAESVARFRGLRSVIHHWPGLYLTWAERRPAFAGERLWTGVNETKTETRPGTSPDRAGLRASDGR